MGSISRRNVLIGASLAAGNLALTACGGSPDPQRGKDAKEFSLTLSANAISGGKNAAQADWDPRGSAGYVYLVLRPDRVQAWREADEIAGRTLMRDGAWLV